MYAMVDRDDDLKIGVKSTAILFNAMDKLIIGLLQALFIDHDGDCWHDVSAAFGLLFLFVFGGFLFAYQQWLIKDRIPQKCFEAFRNNNWVGSGDFCRYFSELSGRYVMKIIADANIPFINEYFGAYGELVLEPGRAITHSDVKDADMLLVRSITHVDKTLLADTSVKFVGSVTAGADHLDTNWLDEAGIAWSVATGFNAPPVADYVVSVIAAMQMKQLLPSRKIQGGGDRCW